MQNRGYFRYPEYNYVYVDAEGSFTYHSFFNYRLNLGYETKTRNNNSLYKGELFVYKTSGLYSIGPFFLMEYFRGDDDSKNIGGGVRIGYNTDNFKSVLSLYSYKSNSDNNLYDNTNYRADVKGYWHFSNVYLGLNYYYNISTFDDYRVNLHYLDFSFNSKESKHIFYTIGFNNYYSLSNLTKEELRKYEIYAKFTYMF